MVSNCGQDIEQGGSNGRKPTEDVIDMLINSYKSSNNSQQVLIQVAQICKQVSHYQSSFYFFFCSLIKESHLHGIVIKLEKLSHSFLKMDFLEGDI